MAIAGRALAILKSTISSMDRPMAMIVRPPTPEIFASTNSVKSGERRLARRQIAPS